jgi:DnaJ-class molecular chaperone
VGDRLFRFDDQLAIERNWQITKRHGGLSRSYRDPRFDTLHACFQCGGSGRTDREWCAACDGTGRVTWADSYRERVLQ